MPDFGDRPADAWLRELGHAFDQAGLRERFGAIWSRERGPVEVTGCARADTKYAPGVSCVVAYDLTGVHAGSVCSTIGVVSVKRTGTAYWLFLDDPALPGLRSAMDAQYVRARVRGAADDTFSGSMSARAVRYKPGVSCVIRYDRAPDTGGELYAKLFASGGAHHAAVLESLAALAGVDGSLPRVPVPVGYIADLGALVERPMEGERLRETVLLEAAPAAAGERLVRDAGRAMAAFHRGVPAPGPSRTLAEDVESAGRHGGLFAALAPEIESRFQACLTTLRDIAGRLPDGAHVASHGAIRLDQIMIGRDGRIGLVDFDGFCAAAAARDVANLLAYLEWRSIRLPEQSTLMTALERGWTEGYSETAGRLPPERSLAAFRAASLLKIAGRSLRSLRVGERQHLPALLERAAGWCSSA